MTILAHGNQHHIFVICPRGYSVCGLVIKKESGFFAFFYKWIPSILLLYLIPAVAVNTGLLQADKTVRLLAMDSALPLCLIILTAIINLPDLMKISKPGLLAFLMGTLRIVIGGPASASVVASAFHPSLVSLGVLLGVLSNVIGNYANLVAGMLYQWVAGA